MHVGALQLYGYYVTYVKNLDGKWFKCNDKIISEFDIEVVLKSYAYIVFYSYSCIYVSMAYNYKTYSLFICTMKNFFQIL